jgi:hypothetical protein
MHNFADTETDRPEFEGDWEISPVNGALTETFPRFKKLKRECASRAVVVVFIGVVIVTIILLLLFRGILVAFDQTYGPIIAAFANAGTIMALNKLYQPVSIKLNSFENHRTDSQYENALITKAFLFKFVNSYASIAYIAFFKFYDEALGFCRGSFILHMRKIFSTEESREFEAKIIDGTFTWDNTWGDDVSLCTLPEPVCNVFFQWGLDNNATAARLAGYFVNAIDQEAENFDRLNTVENGLLLPDLFRGDCLGETAYQLGIVFGTQLFVNNFLELSKPIAKAKMAAKRESKIDPNIPQDGREKSQPELEYELEPYEGTFGDYEELVVQFGYVVLFVVAFPLAPALALGNNLLENWLDATKIYRFSRRPVPRGAQNIGTWYHVLETLAWAAIISNVAMIVTSPRIFSTSDPDQFAKILTAFLVFEHALFAAKALVAYLVPDEPSSVTDHLSRQEYIGDILLGR